MRSLIIIMTAALLLAACDSTPAASEPGSPFSAASAPSEPLPEVTPKGSAAEDRAALVALYHATDGANWDTSTNWLTDAPLSTWYGVTVDSNGRVAELDLRRNGLQGDMPTELSNLGNLQSLDLSWNELTGEVPREFVSLPLLTSLSLESNNLSGFSPFNLFV